VIAKEFVPEKKTDFQGLYKYLAKLGFWEKSSGIAGPKISAPF
jgi:hypothetical protein